MTNVSNYAQTRSLGSAAFIRKNNELNELTLSLQKNATQSHKC